MPRKKTNLTMPVLALRGLMVFPHMVLHFDVGRPKSVAALQEAMMNDQKIFLVAQKDVDDPDPTPENLCTVGTIANIRQVMNLPGDSLRVLVEGETRGELTAVTQEDPFLLGRIHLPKVTAPADEMELAALVRTAKDYFDAYARASQRVSQETIASIRDVDDAEQIADLIAANILTKLEDRQQILEEFDIQRRLERLCTILSREIELTGVEKQVQERVKKQIDKNQKDYYLREHMKAIQTELGDTDATDVEELRERAKNTPLNDEARQRVDKELERLSRMTPGTPEFGAAEPARMMRPSLWPRLVSTTTSTSCPATKPGPRAMVSGAISRVVPRFFLAMMASTSTAGFAAARQLPFGSTKTGTAFCAQTASASASEATRTARRPSTVVSPS